MNWLFILPLTLLSCHFQNTETGNESPKTDSAVYKQVKEIPVPAGYQHTEAKENSFAAWLRNIQLKKENHVYLYDGSLKKNQSAQFAVLNITVGKKNLQQCADAVMRLRAEYLYSQKRFDEISFTDNAGKLYNWQQKENRAAFENYLENVFGWCGSASLEKQLKPVNDMNAIEPGDVFIRGGFPGHAMMVVDVAVNNKGEKIFMLVQSYMPAQDIHIVKNPLNDDLSPWYDTNTSTVITPEWKFYKNQLRRWP